MKLWLPVKRKILTRGHFFTGIWDSMADFKANKKPLRQFDFPNGNTTAGLNSLLDVYFRGVAAFPSWYFLLINNPGTLAAGDTYAVHAGWTENVTYAEASRPQWSPGAASGGVIINASSATFTSGGSITIYGIGVVSNNQKGDTAAAGAKLWATGNFPSPQTLISTQVLGVKYQLTAT